MIHTCRIPVFAFLLLSFFASQGQWTTQRSGFKTPNRFPFTLSVVDKNIVWAASVDAVETFTAPSLEYTKTIDGGKKWVSGKVTDLSNLRSSCITAIDANIAWNSMNDVTQGADGGIFKTSDGGATWKKQATAFPESGAYISLVHFFDHNQGITIGTPAGKNSFEIYVTKDGGEHWTIIPSDKMPAKLAEEKIFDRCYSVFGNTIWVGSRKSRVFKSLDRGVTWKVFEATIDSSHPAIHGLSFYDERNGMAVFYDHIMGKTSDGGKTWSAVSVPSKPSTAYVTHVPEAPGVYVITAPSGFGFAPGSAYTLDNGITWTVLDSIPHQRATFISPTIGWSGGISQDSIKGGMYKWSGKIFLAKPKKK